MSGLLQYPPWESCSTQADPSVMSPMGFSLAKGDFCHLGLAFIPPSLRQKELAGLEVPGATGLHGRGWQGAYGAAQEEIPLC